MGTMAPDELLNLWKLEKLPVEMAVGHILQNLVKIRTDIDATDTSLYKLQADVDDLVAHTGIETRSKDKKKPRKSG
jgi:site-specific recombinase